MMDIINRPTTAVEHPTPPRYNNDALKETNSHLKELLSHQTNFATDMKKLMEDMGNKLDDLKSSHELADPSLSAQSIANNFSDQDQDCSLPSTSSRMEENRDMTPMIPQELQDMARVESCHSKAIRVLTQGLFSQEELKTCSVTGRSNKGGKRRLDPQRVHLIEVFMKTHFNTAVPEVRRIIGDKCRESVRVR
ncbi:hypothetical protein HOLleu_00216 [Holothuria leucospilota]|uniref:BEN domain-containing protein n=1 Tax=Holothuria leucospilota TaxID=206669 RepID=A0A9Q1CNA4_HOLLE|nr:hypothetical protein HOLleu_00216 [Holothuria leucospilota]